MSKTKVVVILANLLLLVGYFNWSIMAKEKTLSKGKLVLLRLAPVDPRSLMQGDYMRLNYEISTAPGGINKRGYCVVTLSDHGVAQKPRFQNDLQPLKAGEFALKYFSVRGWRSNQVQLGAESFFFEEGQGKRFDDAKYGGIRVDDAGNSVLEGLYNEHYQLIKY